ncbi:Thioesterase/thiol ester dehydrase-isomerase [Tothia fuscella]|uniref:Thioesterase/thiol ester dehydrase-isomerase n=1 Tax=Tothia fuscella TaxID=1048955 RepID=A0A9P4NRG8_9PEZI|nr:Thioesterase/thiol ester dehydrase-isomerase [Tothia fuscella]
MRDIEKKAEVSQQTIEHFKSIPWVAQYLADESFKPFYQSRVVTHGGEGHTLTGKTWHTDDTIKELLSTYRQPSRNSIDEEVRGEVRRFYTFGKGLNAHPGLLHGGVIATLLDSTLGSAVGMSDPDGGRTMFTVQLNVAYRNPVRTPGTIMITSWVTKREGRKVWVSGRIEGGNGEIHAEGEGLWLAQKAKI